MHTSAFSFGVRSANALSACHPERWQTKFFPLRGMGALLLCSTSGKVVILSPQNEFLPPMMTEDEKKKTDSEVLSSRSAEGGQTASSDNISAAESGPETDETATDEPASDTPITDEPAPDESQSDGNRQLHPAPSLSRTTNIPPLMPAGFTPGAVPQPETPSGWRKGLRKKAAPAPVAEPIGKLRSESDGPRPSDARPQQRRMKMYHGKGRRFFRRNGWWMLLVVLLIVIGVSLPWTLPVMQEWEGSEPDTLTVDTPTVAPKPQPVVPDTIGAAARADSLRQDSIRRAAARAYWIRRRAQQQAEEEAAASAESESSTPGASPSEQHQQPSDSIRH